MVDYFLAAFVTFDYERIFSRAVLSLNPMGLPSNLGYRQGLNGGALGLLLPWFQGLSMHQFLTFIGV